MDKLKKIMLVLLIVLLVMAPVLAQEPTPTPHPPGEDYYYWLPIVFQSYEPTQTFHWYWRLLVGSWEGYQGGPEKQEARDWAEEFFGSREMAYYVGCFPPDPLPSPWPTDLCNWRVVGGYWQTEEQAEIWGRAHIPDGMPWEPVLANFATEKRALESGDLTPRAWLPLVTRPLANDVRLALPQAVVEAGTPFGADVRVTTRGTNGWSGRVYWTSSLRGVNAHYDDGLWNALVRVDGPPDWLVYSVGLSQSSWLNTSADYAAVAWVSVVTLEAQEEPVTLCGIFRMNGLNYASCVDAYVMACVTDWNGDRVRDGTDMLNLEHRFGCRRGIDPCYSPLFDLDGDGEIGRADVVIAELYQGRPCP